MNNPGVALQLYPERAQLRRINREFVRYVRSSFPMRFGEHAPPWKVCAAADVLRMCDTLESMMLLLSRRKDGDALALLRILYEQAVLFAWTLADPSPRFERRMGQAEKDRLARHNEAVQYGERLLTDEEVAVARAAVGLPKIEVMTRAADRYWTSEVAGLHPSGHWLSFHGLYQSIYRLGSTRVHGSLEALDAYFSGSSFPITIAEARPDSMLWYSLAAPMFGITLAIAARDFAWLDDVRIRRFVDRATAETTRRRQH